MNTSTSDRYRLAAKTVWRVGYGAMQLAGDGVYGPPRDRDEALAVLRAADYTSDDGALASVAAYHPPPQNRSCSITARRWLSSGAENGKEEVRGLSLDSRSRPTPQRRFNITLRPGEQVRHKLRRMSWSIPQVSAHRRWRVQFPECRAKESRRCIWPRATISPCRRPRPFRT